MQEERKQKEKIRMMEEQLDIQKSELERLQAEKDMEDARAGLEIYEREIRSETNSQPIQQNIGQITFNPPYVTKALTSLYQRPLLTCPIWPKQFRTA